MIKNPEARLASERRSPDGPVYPPLSYEQFNEYLRQRPEDVVRAVAELSQEGEVSKELADVAESINAVLDEPTAIGLGPNPEYLWGRVWEDEDHKRTQSAYNRFGTEHMMELSQLNADIKVQYDRTKAEKDKVVQADMIMAYEAMLEHPLLVEYRRLARERSRTTLGAIAWMNVDAPVENTPGREPVAA